MKTLHSYLVRQVLGSLLLTVAVFTFVMLLGNVLREIFALLFNDQTTLKTVAKAIGLLTPYMMAFTLPMGMLTATLLVFGRISAEQELTAMRAGGISLVAAATPILLLSVLLSVACAGVNMYLAPKSRMAYKTLLFGLTHQRPTSLLTEQRFVKDIPGYIIYVNKIEGDFLYDVLVSKLNADGGVETNLRAPKGQLLRDPDTQQLGLQLWEVRGATLEDGVWRFLYFADLTQPLKLPDLEHREPKLTEMTFFQLRAELARLDKAMRSTAPIPTITSKEMRDKLKEVGMPLQDMTETIKVQMHQQVAFSFACIGFTLVGIPLGIRAHRKETSIGVAIALILVLVYYSFFIVAVSLDKRPDLAPHLIVWIPNFIFQAIGAVLLWRANRN